jgi:hypothetical protein
VHHHLLPHQPANLLPVVVAKKARESLKNLSRLFM